MLNLKEKNMLTNEQLEAKLASLRAKEKLMRGLAFCAFALLFISGVVTGNVLVFLFFLVIMIVIACFWMKANNDVKQFLSDNVISSVLEEVFGNTVEFKPFEKLNPGGVVVPFHYIGSEGENHIREYTMACALSWVISGLLMRKNTPMETAFRQAKLPA